MQQPLEKFFAMDDGLLLNVASEPAAPPGRTSRAQARRGAQRGATRAGPTAKRSAPPEESARSHAAKRARAAAPATEDSDDGRTALSSSAHEESRRAMAHVRRITGHSDARKSSGYISSLFTRDEANADEPAAAPVAAAVAPSNAPSGDVTFEALGLESIIANHLRTRMGIDGRPTEIQRRAIPPLLSAPPATMRDVLLQAQTGSGKTLTYLLPILQSLLPLSEESFIDRSVGTLAIVLAPTRELARQIYQVLERLLTLSLSTPEEGEVPRRRSRWIVPGLLTGGSTKNHEKQRLRKGCPILVSTPGRLLDHLQNTASLDVGKCRWLVLDEADRLLEMGFEEQLSGIVKALEGRRRLALSTAREALEASGVAPRSDADVVDSLGIPWWAWRRRVVLCSATLDERVQVFSGTTLHEPLLVRAGAEEHVEESVPTFSAPSQLQQHAVIVPPKLRLVSLIALLRRSLPRTADAETVGAARIVVFFSCTDSVDFHWRALGGAKMRSSSADAADSTADDAATTPPLAQHSDLLPGAPIYRLHGSMTQTERIASLRAFHQLTDGTDAPPARRGGVLLCTSVASRGLDLPDVRCVVQMDVPTEGVEEYVHRVGRTARAGRQGTSWLLLLPHEKVWLTTLAQRMVVASERPGAPPRSPTIHTVSYDTVLYEGFGGAAREYESRATDVQMALERWVLAAPPNASLARTAFLAHIRAYATHPANDKAVFNVNQLHLGHLAKAFALREAPNTVQKTAKREHDRQAKPQERVRGAEERRQRMMANLPQESM